jgi:hypothetical protein
LQISFQRIVENPAQETRRALAALETEHHFAQRYAEFLRLMIYGVKPDFAEAIATVASRSVGYKI